MKKILSIILSILLITVLFCSCDDNEPPENTAKTPAQTQGSEQPSQNAEKTDFSRVDNEFAFEDGVYLRFVKENVIILIPHTFTSSDKRMEEAKELAIQYSKQYTDKGYKCNILITEPNESGKLDFDAKTEDIHLVYVFKSVVTKSEAGYSVSWNALSFSLSKNTLNQYIDRILATA